jgi:hypothetical protein
VVFPSWCVEAAFPAAGFDATDVDCCTGGGVVVGWTSAGRSTNFVVSTAFGVPATCGASEDCGASAIAGALAAGFAGAVVAELSLDSVRLRDSPAWAE